MKESAIQAAVMEHWKLVGCPNTLIGCIPNAKAHGQPGLTKGLPDLLVLGPHVPGHVALVELKRDYRSIVSDDQRLLARLCWDLGVTWELARGRDEPIELLRTWGVVR
jgi:hypothetical protein